MQSGLRVILMVARWEGCCLEVVYEVFVSKSYARKFVVCFPYATVRSVRTRMGLCYDYRDRATLLVSMRLAHRERKPSSETLPSSPLPRVRTLTLSVASSLSPRMRMKGTFATPNSRILAFIFSLRWSRSTRRPAASRVALTLAA